MFFEFTTLRNSFFRFAVALNIIELFKQIYEVSSDTRHLNVFWNFWREGSWSVSGAMSGKSIKKHLLKNSFSFQLLVSRLSQSLCLRHERTWSQQKLEETARKLGEQMIIPNKQAFALKMTFNLFHHLVCMCCVVFSLQIYSSTSFNWFFKECDLLRYVLS